MIKARKHPEQKAGLCVSLWVNGRSSTWHCSQEHPPCGHRVHVYKGTRVWAFMYPHISVHAPTHMCVHMPSQVTATERIIAVAFLGLCYLLKAIHNAAATQGLAIFSGPRKRAEKNCRIVCFIFSRAHTKL